MNESGLRTVLTLRCLSSNFQATLKSQGNGLASARFTAGVVGDDLGEHLQGLGVAAGGVVSNKLVAFEVADGSMEGVSGYVQHLL